MNSYREYAYAKLNLTLSVGKKRPDGYHELQSVMQSVSLRDEVILTLNESGIIRAKSNLPYLPCDQRNIAVKAAKLFLEKIGKPEIGVTIEMKKTIPVGAGMAGGSTDGAAVLRGLNRILDAGMSRDELEKLSEQLGSDVPFCVAGGTQLCCGRGEVLTELPELPMCFFTIVKPDFPISTPELYNTLDSVRRRMSADTDGIITAIGQGSVRETARRLFNSFEEALPRKYGVINRIRSELLDEGAEAALMTGTGSAVYGIFTAEPVAQRARERFIKQGFRQVFVANPIPKLI